MCPCPSHQTSLWSGRSFPEHLRADIPLFSGVEALSRRSAWILAQHSQCSRLQVVLSRCWISLWSLPGWLLRSGHASVLGSSAWVCPACSTTEWRAIIAVSSCGLLLKKCKLLFQPEATRRSQFLNSVFILFLSSTMHHPKEFCFFFPSFSPFYRHWNGGRGERGVERK